MLCGVLGHEAHIKISGSDEVERREGDIPCSRNGEPNGARAVSSPPPHSSPTSTAHTPTTIHTRPHTQINLELMYAIDFNLAHMYHMNKNYSEALNLYQGEAAGTWYS